MAHVAPLVRLCTSLTIAVGAFAVRTAAAQHDDGDAPPPVIEYGTTPIAASAIEGWRHDLDHLARQLDSIHPAPYRHVSRAEFARAVGALRDSIPALPAHRIVVGFARLLAMVGDGHTSLPLYFARGVNFHVLPIRFGVYEDGLYVEAADAAWRDLVGGRVTSIGGVSAREALDRAAMLISRDNDHWIAAVAPHLLNRIEVLHALGMATSLEGAEITVDRDGRRLTSVVRPLAQVPHAPYGLPFLPRYTDQWVDARDGAAAPVPLYQRDFDEAYGWTWLEGDSLLYIKWDAVRNRDHGPTALEIFREALAFARERRPARTVIDLRNNSGGEGGLLPPIIREIVRTREVDQPGRLYAIIGRRTFSAAQMMTSLLQQLTTAILVGEPTSAFYTGPAGHAAVRLPASGITAMVSPDLYQMGVAPRDGRRQATPRVAAVPTFDDYRQNRDPALQAILHHEPERTANAVVQALESNDQAAARAAIAAHSADPANRFLPATTAVNQLGYRLLREGRQALAVAAFELNVAVHPGYANGWDSLGEAYVAAGRRDEAIAAFRRALELDPSQASSKEWLHRLGAAG